MADGNRINWAGAYTEVDPPRRLALTLTDDPWIWVRGIRAPGAEIPLVLSVGTWKFHGGKDFLAIKGKRQAVVIDLMDSEFSRVLLSTKHAPDLVASLKLPSSDALQGSGMSMLDERLDD